jgi:hypothetical protein
VAYREPGEGWELAWWPAEPPDAGISPDALGRRAAAPDAALLAELTRQVDLGPDRPLDPAATLVRRRPLPFYDRAERTHELHEVFRLGAGVAERARLVRVAGPGGRTVEWLPIPWTSAPIHDLNTAAGAAGGGAALLADAGAAVAYTDFFTGSIEGDAGTFHVVRFGDCQPARGEDGSERFDVGADVLYAGGLFHCTFRVSRDGTIEMADDEPFEDPALQPEHRWLDGTTRLKPTVRLYVSVGADEFIKCMTSGSPEVELMTELERAVDSPDTLARWARRGDPLTIVGNVTAPAGTRFLHDFDLGAIFAGRRVVLQGSLNLSRCRLEQGLSLARWELREGCRLEHAEIHGDLRVQDARISSPPSTFGADLEPALDLRAAHVSGDVRLDRARIEGGMLLRYARIRGRLGFLGTECTGSVDAEGIEVGGLFTGNADAGRPTRIDGDFVLSAARIPGHVQLEPLVVGRDFVVVTPLELGALYLREQTGPDGAAVEGAPQSSVGGEVRLGNVAVAGRLEIRLAACGAGIELRNVSAAALLVRGAVGPRIAAAGLEARGDVLLQDLAFDGAAAGSPPPLNLRHARIAGDLLIAGPAAHAAGVPGPVALGGAEVKGQLTLRSLRIAGSLDLGDLVAQRNIAMEGVEVGGTLAMRHLDCRGDADLAGAAVDGDVELHHAVVNGMLGLCEDRGALRTRIGGKLLLNALTAGKLVMTGDSWPTASASAAPAAGGGTLAAGWLAWPALIGLLLVGLPLAAFAVLGGTLAAGAIGAAMLGGIEYEGDWAALWIGLKWLFWTAVAAVALYRVGRMWSMLHELRRAPAARSILTAATDGPDDARLYDELARLWGAALARALLLVALAGTVFATRIWPELAAAAPGGVPDAPALPWVALLFAVAWIALLNVRVCGATGYWLAQLGRPAGAGGAGAVATLFALDVAAYVFAIAWLALGVALPGHVRLGAALAVTALLAALVRLAAARPAPSTLRMGFLDAASDGAGGAGRPANALRLDAAQVALSFRDWLQVATMNRLRPDVVPRHEPKCSLERARIGHLQVVHPVPDWVDIGHLVVDRWELPENPGDTRSYQYLNLLSHAAEFATDNFTALERSLRNAGDREAAESLHRSMRRETQWRERRWGETAFMLLLSLSGFGTKRARLIGLMTLWLLATAFWFAADYDRAVGIGLAQQAEYMEVADDQCMPVAGEPPLPAAGGPARASPEACVESARAKLFGSVLAAADAPLDRLGHGLAIAIRYHVPIIAWDIRPFIYPRGAGMWVYVSVVEAIHWVLWPLLIASLVPAILPRKDD